MLRSTALALCLVAALAAPAFAIHDPDLPTLASGEFAGPGWVAIRLSTPGTEVVGEASVWGKGGPVGAASFGYAGNGSWQSTNTYAGFPGQHGVAVDAGFGAVRHDALNRGDFHWQGVGVGSGFNDPRSPVTIVGERVLLLFAAGDIERFAWRLQGGEGVEILGITSGVEAYLLTSSEFRSAASAHAYEDGWGVRANVASMRDLSIERALVGIYAPVLASANAFAVTGPQGVEPCTDVFIALQPICHWGETTGPDARGPGDYTFHATGAGGGISGLAEFYLLAADVELPLAPEAPPVPTS
ncbi:MAG TPA: hypothetical protein VM889_14360 [Candidatus Thermoplasmatota archaeon]|nr:hypothetical protein [Candidatus Thermoplasmatota archaeon]